MLSAPNTMEINNAQTAVRKMRAGIFIPAIRQDDCIVGCYSIYITLFLIDRISVYNICSMMIAHYHHTKTLVGKIKTPDFLFNNKRLYHLS